MPQVPDEWTVLSMIKWGTAFFDEKGIPSPRLSIEWLLADVLETRRLNLYLLFDRPLSETELAELREKIRRRLKHEPLQYIIGYTDFMRAHVMVTPDVLIPRPETELLVETVLETIQMKKTCSVLDIGTGSGCIAISLKMERPKWDVYAVDISETALNLARQNSSLNATEVCFLVGDLFRPATFSGGLPEKLDVIVSNPPYIPNSERPRIDREVKDYEPEIALFTEDITLVYRSVRNIGEQLLKTGGYLFLEIHEDYGQDLINVFQKNNWETSLLRDYSNKNRIISALYKG